MARPIKETPILNGKDAQRFLEEVAAGQPASEEEKQHAKAVYERFKAIATFMM